MTRFFHSDKQFAEIVKGSNAQLVFLGGHGGLVAYDGNGGAMKKEGGPMDRVLLLMNDGRLLGDAILAIECGNVTFRTGRLIGEVTVEDEEAKGPSIYYQFSENEDVAAFEVVGGIPMAGLDIHASLVSGNVEKSFMVWRPEDRFGSKGSLPYAAWHRHVRVNDQLLNWFTLNNAIVMAAETSWTKPPKPTLTAIRDMSSFGPPVRTQQHLAHLRVFLKF